ncbi:sensor histidine kinase [Terasakiella sp.]|uniref:sensor histidine kinase n=1 Tax=Terasakiella sp. TaxID=2034861 RepID=UPI003AA9529B
MLDIRTLTVVLGAVYTISAVMVYFAYRQNKQIDGPREWSVGLMFFACGFLLLLLRGMIAPFASIVIANSLIAIGNAILFLGIQKYLGLKPNYKLAIAINVILFVAFLFLYDDNRNLNTRIHLITIINLIFFLGSGFLLLQRFAQTKSSAYLLAGGGFLFDGSNLLLRSVWMIVKNENVTYLMNNSTSTAFLFLSISMGHILITVGLLMLISERLQENLASALKSEKQARLEQNNFWAMVSHEFKTPLGTILNSTQLVENLEKDIQAVSRDALDRVRRATFRLSRLVDKSLIHEWTSSTTNDNIRQVEFSLTEILNNLSFEYEIPFHNHNKDHNDILLQGDPFLLSTAFSCLIDNALKYGTNRDSCYVSIQMENNDTVIVDVFNEGAEIPVNIRERIFEKFYRAKQHAGISGSGFGLYITEKIIHLHKAHIEILHQEGTIFRTTFNQERTTK